MYLKTIKENINNELIIKKSTFITELIKVNDKGKVKDILSSIKNKYEDATHYCYAYIIDDNRKSSDDGEPGGTAGIPIMEVLNKFELNYVICIVIRYFGGIKLGSGGLVRAYRKSVSDALNNNSDKIISLIDGYKLKAIVPYEKQKEIEYLLEYPYTKDFNELVTYDIKCDESVKDIILSKYEVLKIEKEKIEAIK